MCTGAELPFCDLWGWFGSHWRDVLDVLSVIATVAAAGLAWLTVRQVKEQADLNAQALVRERRLDFELNHLDAMDEALDKGPNVAGASETLVRGLRLLPGAEFPQLRGYVGLEETPASSEVSQEVNKRQSERTHMLSDLQVPLERGVTYEQLLRGEIHTAMRRRLDERG